MHHHYAKKAGTLLALFMASWLLAGCATIKLGPSYNEEFKEQTVEEGKNTAAKVLIINIEGILSDTPKPGLLTKAPSVMDAVLMQLKKAEDDKDIKAVLLKINSPGGGVTSSDILYHELMAFKAKTKKKLVVQMMDVTASGGYYISMAADYIQAHPTTITGSVGVISVMADISATMDKVGVGVNVYKTGASKDMGSPFRPANAQDKMLFQSLVDEMAKRFYSIVLTNRKLSAEQLSELKTARVYSGEAALQAGLVDSLGYLAEATDKACALADEKSCEVVTYRYQKNKNATVYSPNMSDFNHPVSMALIQSPLVDSALNLQPGLHYLYLQ